MTPQTFRGRSLDEARRSAAQALGPSAIVLASRRLPKNGLFGMLGGTEFEVTAASREIEAAPLPAARRHPFADAVRLSAPQNAGAEHIRDEVRAEIRALRALIASQRTETTQAPSDAMTRELEELRELVHELTMERDAPKKGKRRISALGLEGTAERTLQKKLKDVSGEPTDDELREALEELLEPAPWPLDGDGRKLIALVGPTGVGKTTTAAKLAARAILNHDSSVTLITCDGYRVGAQEQMARFAELLGAEFVAVTDKVGLVRAIDAAKTDVVIVDTAGRGPAEPDGIEAALARLRPRAAMTRHTLLCLPAALREVDARAIGRYFAACKPTALAITKLDETTSPVGLVHASLSTKLGVSVLCSGQRVPDDIAPASREHMASALVSSSTPGGGGLAKRSS